MGGGKFSQRGPEQMANKFFEFFEQTDQKEKFNGKPLIRRRGFLSPVSDTITDILIPLSCIALIDLTAMGFVSLVNKPLRDMIFSYAAKLFFGS